MCLKVKIIALCHLWNRVPARFSLKLSSGSLPHHLYYTEISLRDLFSDPFFHWSGKAIKVTKWLYSAHASAENQKISYYLLLCLHETINGKPGTKNIAPYFVPCKWYTVDRFLSITSDLNFYCRELVSYDYNFKSKFNKILYCNSITRGAGRK